MAVTLSILILFQCCVLNAALYILEKKICLEQNFLGTSYLLEYTKWFYYYSSNPDIFVFLLASVNSGKFCYTSANIFYQSNM